MKVVFSNQEQSVYFLLFSCVYFVWVSYVLPLLPSKLSLHLLLNFDSNLVSLHCF